MKTKLWLFASAVALAWCGAASAQTTGPGAEADKSKSTTVQEVVITAERRTTNLQKTAIAATVLTGAELTKKGVFTVDQLQFVSPSVTVNNFGQGNNIDIRGIGKGEHNSQTTTGVITYRDGAATFPGYFQEEPYYDIADVEVLRGPQGTFSGQNATGGALIVNSQNPVINGGNTGYLQGHYGNYNDTGVQGAVNLPINDTLAARVAFNTEYHDTFYKISGPISGDQNTKWGSLRLSFLWKPTSALTVLWKTDYNYLDNGGYFGDAMTNQGTSKLFKFSNDFHTYALDQFIRSTLKVDYVSASGITFRSVTSAQTGRTAWQGDIDGQDSTANPLAGVSIDEAVNETLLSQEFNIISPSKGPLTWIAGADYSSNVYNFPFGAFDIGFPPGGIDEQLYGANRTHNWAVFGQVSYNLPMGFQLQVGGRYSEWSTTDHAIFEVPELLPLYPMYVSTYYKYNDFQTYSGSNLTGKVTLNWDINAHNFLYVFVASGAKPGGLNGNLLFGGGTLPAPFKQETVVDYEAGWKSSMFDNHLRTQVGIYDNNYKNFQLIVPIPDEPTQSTEQNVPGTTQLYGVEGSAQLVYGDFAASAGIGLEKTKVGKFYSEDPRGSTGGTCDPQSGPATTSCINLAGHRETYAPEVTYNISLQYNFKLDSGDVLTPLASFSHISDQWATLFANRAAGDYLTPRDIANASVSWTHGRYVATVYCYNLTDDHYVAAVASPIRLAGPPRQFGVSLMKTF